MLRPQLPGLHPSLGTGPVGTASLTGVTTSLVETLETPRAVVTGGAGFVGSTLVDRLVDDGLSVLVVDDLSSGHLEHLSAARRHGDVQFHQLDVREELLGAVVTRFAPSVVFHLAARGHTSDAATDPVATASVDFVGAVNVVEAARLAGVTRVVYVTAAREMYGPAARVPVGVRAARRPTGAGGVSAGGVLEYLAHAARRHGIGYAALGTATVYGPRQAPGSADAVVVGIAGPLLADQRPVLAGDGSQTRDLVYVDDVADAAVRAAMRGGNRYFHIASGVETTLVELARRLREITGSVRRPELDEDRQDEWQRMAFDAGAARERLGWRPWTSLDDGLRQTVAWLKAQTR